MKTLMIMITAILFAASISFAAETFAPVTQDDEVVEIDQVKVKKTITTSSSTDTVYTLQKIDSDITKKQARISHLQGNIVELQALRAKVLIEAKKVKLRELDKTPIDPIGE